MSKIKESRCCVCVYVSHNFSTSFHHRRLSTSRHHHHYNHHIIITIDLLKIKMWVCVYVFGRVRRWNLGIYKKFQNFLSFKFNLLSTNLEDSFEFKRPIKDLIAHWNFCIKKGNSKKNKNKRVLKGSFESFILLFFSLLNLPFECLSIF